MRRSLWISIGLLVLAVLLSWLIWPWHFVSGPYGATVPPERAKLATPQPEWSNQQLGSAFGELMVDRGGYGGPALVARRADGSVYWQYRRLMPPQMPLWAGVRDHLVVAVWCDDWVVGIHVPTGRIAWSTKLPSGPDGAYCLGGTDDQRVHMWTVYTHPGSQFFDIVRVSQRTRIDARSGRILD